MGGKENSCHKERGVQTLPLRPLGNLLWRQLTDGRAETECWTVWLYCSCISCVLKEARWSSREGRLGSLAMQQPGKWGGQIKARSWRRSEWDNPLTAWRLQLLVLQHGITEVFCCSRNLPALSTEWRGVCQSSFLWSVPPEDVLGHSAGGAQMCEEFLLEPCPAWSAFVRPIYDIAWRKDVLQFLRLISTFVPLCIKS